jgi:hypothetical protein
VQGAVEDEHRALFLKKKNSDHLSWDIICVCSGADPTGFAPFFESIWFLQMFHFTFDPLTHTACGSSNFATSRLFLIKEKPSGFPLVAILP